jgi:DNA-binding NarL/FixJ family response regulator
MKKTDKNKIIKNKKVAIICNHEKLSYCLRDWLTLLYPELNTDIYSKTRDNLARIFNYKPGLIIIDVGLNPDESICLFRCINQKLSDTPIIVTATFIDDVLKESLNNKTIDFLIDKQKIKTELNQVINRLLN